MGVADCSYQSIQSTGCSLVPGKESERAESCLFVYVFKYLHPAVLLAQQALRVVSSLHQTLIIKTIMKTNEMLVLPHLDHAQDLRQAHSSTTLVPLMV